MYAPNNSIPRGPWTAAGLRGGILGSDGGAASRRAVAVGCGRAFRGRQIQPPPVAGHYRAGLPDRGPDLVLPRTTPRPSRAGLALPHFVGAGLLCSPHAKYVHALRPARGSRGKIPTWFEHGGSAAGGNGGRQGQPLSSRRRVGGAPLRRLFHFLGLCV